MEPFHNTIYILYILKNNRNSELKVSLLKFLLQSLRGYPVNNSNFKANFGPVKAVKGVSLFSGAALKVKQFPY